MPDIREGYWAKDGSFQTTGYSHTPSQTEIWENQEERQRINEYNENERSRKFNSF